MGKFINLQNETGLQIQFYEKCKYRSSLEINYIMSHKETLAAFIAGKDTHTSIFSILDMKFRPLFAYRTDAYVGSCSISDDGTKAVCLTCKSNSDDSLSLFFFNVKEKSLEWKQQLNFHIKHVKNIFINIETQIISLSCGDIVYEYDFNGFYLTKNISEDTYIKSKTTSSYSLTEQAVKMIDTLDDIFNEDVEKSILKRLKVASNDSKMSQYQLSLAYKKLADCYMKHGFNKEALDYYNKGLVCNPSLSVKKKIKKLCCSLGITYENVTNKSSQEFIPITKSSKIKTECFEDVTSISQRLSYDDLNDEEKILYNNFKNTVQQVGKNFIEGLKSPLYKEALDNVENLEDMSDTEFIEFVSERCKLLSEFEFNEVKRVIKKRVLTHQEDDSFSLREIILLDVQGIINSHNKNNY